MDTSNIGNVDKMNFILEGLRVPENEIKTEEWWLIIKRAIYIMRIQIKNLLGYKDFGSLVNTNKVDGIRRTNTGITECEEPIDPYTRFFWLFQLTPKVPIGDPGSGLIKEDYRETVHVMLSWDGEIFTWTEGYCETEGNSKRPLRYSRAAFLTEKSLSQLSEMSWENSENVSFGYRILRELLRLVQDSIVSREQRLIEQRSIRQNLEAIFKRIATQNV